MMGKRAHPGPESPKDLQDTALAQNIKIISDLFSDTCLRENFLASTVEKIRDWTDCQAVGIRVVNADNLMPYEAYVGFSYEFWKSENRLSLCDHQCVCIRVVNGNPDPADRPLITEEGSLWSNRLQEFGQGIAPELLPRYRGKCLESKFETLAVVPIRHDDKVLGIIHLADRRKNMLPLEKMQILESVTPAIGEVITRFSTEDALHQKEKFAARLIETMEDGLSVLDSDGVHVAVNPALCAMTGFSRDELLGRGLPHPYWPPGQQAEIQAKIYELREGKTGQLKMQFQRKDGSRFPVLVHPTSLTNPQGEIQFYFATVKDISELESSREQLAEKVTQLSAALDKIKTLEGILPICMYCKKIRDESEHWHQLESYISSHSEVLFSHALCPECATSAHELMRRDKDFG
jgi:PAS domain S-box-containing protein